jgi:hypothetical protein
MLERMFEQRGCGVKAQLGWTGELVPITNVP